MDKPVVVVDTNIVVSSIFWEGNPYKIIQAGINQEIIMFTSPKMIEELKTVLKRDFHLEEQEITDIVDAFLLFSHITQPFEKVNAVKEDEKDNMVLECAVSCNANYIIS